MRGFGDGMLEGSLPTAFAEPLPLDWEMSLGWVFMTRPQYPGFHFSDLASSAASTGRLHLSARSPLSLFLCRVSLLLSIRPPSLGIVRAYRQCRRRHSSLLLRIHDHHHRDPDVL